MVSKQGDIDLYKVLKESSKKLSERHKGVLNGFYALTEDEKNQIYDKIKQIGTI